MSVRRRKTLDGRTGIGRPIVDRLPRPPLGEVCPEFPDPKVVMAHFGWPWTDVTLDMALRNPKVFIDVSGWRARYIPPNLLPYLNGILRDRFHFGRDYPMMRQKEWMDDFDAHLRPKLKQDVAERLLFRNAERLLSD